MASRRKNLVIARAARRGARLNSDPKEPRRFSFIKTSFDADKQMINPLGIGGRGGRGAIAACKPTLWKFWSSTLCEGGERESDEIVWRHGVTIAGMCCWLPMSGELSGCVDYFAFAPSLWGRLKRAIALRNALRFGTMLINIDKQAPAAAARNTFANSHKSDHCRVRMGLCLITRCSAAMSISRFLWL